MVQVINLSIEMYQGNQNEAFTTGMAPIMRNTFSHEISMMGAMPVAKGSSLDWMGIRNILTHTGSSGQPTTTCGRLPSRF